jgi:hypothetical protein
MLKKILLIIILFLALPLLAQKEAANWYFGDHAGLDFNSGSPVALTNGQLDQLEGTATISNASGQLLFYTDGITVYNSIHQIMQNGTDLHGDPSSTQSAIIIPAPGDVNKYYVFAVDGQGEPNGITYSVVDMSLDGGLGGVVPTQKNIQLATPVAEKLTAVYHANQRDIWIIGHRISTAGSNEYIAYKVTSSGIDPSPIVSTIGDLHSLSFNGWGAIGYLKISPDGSKLACAKTYGTQGLELFDFDKQTGQVTG